MGDFKNKIKLHLNANIIRNFISIGFMQFTNLLTPVLIFPYLIKTVGIVNFGSISLYLAILNYLSIIIDFGFNKTAVRKVSQNRNDNSVLSTIMSEILICKTLISIFVYSITIFIIFVYKKNEFLMYVFSLLYIIGIASTPTWFLQGIEKMKYITFFNFLSKIFFILFVLLFLKDSKQYQIFSLLYGLSYFLVGPISLLYTIKKFNLKIKTTPISQLYSIIRENTIVFLSSLILLGLTNSNIIIVSYFFNKSDLGIYSIAEKFITIVSQLLSSFSQVVYPKICYLIENSLNKLNDFIKYTFFPFLILILIIGALSVIFSSNISDFFSKQNEKLESLIKMASFIPIVVCTNIPAYSILLSLQKNKEIIWIFTISAFFHIILCTIFALNNFLIGIFVASILSNTLLSIMMYYIIGVDFIKFSIFSKNTIKNEQ